MNHAAFQDQLFTEYSGTDVLAADMRRILDVNVVGITVAVMKALPLVRQTNGQIIFVSSGSSLLGTPFHSVYAAR